MSDQSEAEKKTGSRGAGQSGGGSYPNPHDHKGDESQEGWNGHGGQTDMPYHGPGQLGDEDVGQTPNATARKGGAKPA